MHKRNTNVRCLLFLFSIFPAAKSCAIIYDAWDGHVVANCSNLQLKQIPEDLPVNITYLDLSHNELDKIVLTRFKWIKNLKVLDLTDNSITYFSKISFDGLNKLQLLNISSNPTCTDATPASVWRLLQASLLVLRVLDTTCPRKNDTILFGNNTIETLTNLRELHVTMTGNQILGIALRNLTKLRVLRLTGATVLDEKDASEIITVTLNEFTLSNVTRELQLFHVSNAKEISPSSLKEMTKLKTLNIGCSQLKLMDFFVAFKNSGTDVIDTLILDGNNVDSPVVDKNMLCRYNLKTLRKASIRRVNLDIINSNALECVRDLEDLTYGFNTLRTHPDMKLIEAINIIMLLERLGAKNGSFDLDNFGNPSEGKFRFDKCIFNGRHPESPESSFFRVPPKSVKTNQIPNRYRIVSNKEDYYPILMAKNIPQNIRYLYLKRTLPLDFKLPIAGFEINDDNQVLYADLSGNYFRFNVPFIKGFNTLQMVDFTDCGITRFGFGYWKTLPSMTHLIAAGNNMEDIAKDFLYAYSMEYLDLSSSNIKSIDDMAFRDLLSMKTLQLGGNYFLKFPNFTSMTKLQFLNISDHGFKYLDKHSVTKLLELKSIRGSELKIELGEQPLLCDCQSIEMIRQWTKLELPSTLCWGSSSFIHEQNLMLLKIRCSWPYIVVTAAIILLLVTILVAFLVPRYHWKIRLFLYKLKNACLSMRHELRRVFNIQVADDEQPIGSDIINDITEWDVMLVYDRDVDDDIICWLRNTLVQQLRQRFDFTVFMVDDEPVFPGIPHLQYMTNILGRSNYVFYLITEGCTCKNVDLNEMLHLTIASTSKKRIIPFFLDKIMNFEILSQNTREILGNNEPLFYPSDDQDGEECFYKSLQSRMIRSNR